MPSELKNVHFLGFLPPNCFAGLLPTADFHLIPQKPEAADLVLPSKLSAFFAFCRPVIVMADLNTGLAEGRNSGVAAELYKADIKLADELELRSALGRTLG